MGNTTLERNDFEFNMLFVAGANPPEKTTPADLFTAESNFVFKREEPK